MLQDSYANYVVQTSLDVADPDQHAQVFFFSKKNILILILILNFNPHLYFSLPN